MSGYGAGIYFGLSGEFVLRRKIKDLEKKVTEISNQLHQQKFNNAHNLSIDQTVADRIHLLENMLLLSRNFLEDSEENYEEHAGDCNFHEAWKAEDAFCTCGASNWVTDRRTLIQKLHKVIPPKNNEA